MFDKHGDIVDQICLEAGIIERRRKRSPTLDKKEALHILEFIRTIKKVKEGHYGTK